MQLRVDGSLIAVAVLAGCSGHPLTPSGAGGFTMVGSGGAAGLGGAAGMPGEDAGLAGAGGAPVDASLPDPWSYGGRPVTRIDIKRCPPYYGCDVCTFTLADAADAAVPNNYDLPSPMCSPPPGDGGMDASPPSPATGFGCYLAGPDGGIATVTGYTLWPNRAAPPNQTGYPNAYCQFLPGPVIASPDPCLLYLADQFCVSDCSACP